MTSERSAPKRGPPRIMVGIVALFGCVAHSLDVVPVGITHEGPVVVRVVLGPHPRLVEYFGARGHRGFEEGLDGGSVGRIEGYVRLRNPSPVVRGPTQKSGF